jgi:hypothetical protein
MICPKCNSMLQIAKSYLTFENDTTPDLPTKAFTNLEMVCVNQHCDNYAGKELENPSSVVEIVKNETI